MSLLHAWERVPGTRGRLLVSTRALNCQVIGHEAALHTALASAGEAGLRGTAVVRLGGVPQDAHNEARRPRIERGTFTLAAAPCPRLAALTEGPAFDPRRTQITVDGGEGGTGAARALKSPAGTSRWDLPRLGVS